MSSVDAANRAQQNGQTQLVGEKTDEATQAAQAATREVQKLDNKVIVLTNNSTYISSSVNSSPAPKTAVITKTDGTTLWVYKDSLSVFGRSDRIDLNTGQSIDFPKVKAIEVLNVDNGVATIRLTLVDGRTIQGAAYSPNGAAGHNDLGDVNVPVEQLKGVDIPR